MVPPQSMLTLFSVPLSLLVLAPRLGLCDDSSDSDDSTSTLDLKQNSDNCSCYAIGSGSSNSSEFFQYHRFYDFRSLATSADQFTTPDPVSNGEDQGTEGVADDDAGYLNSTDFVNDWGIQSWGTNASADFPVRMVNTARNIYITQTNASDTGNTDSEYPTYLTMRVVRLADFSSSSEMQNNQQNMMHASVRMWARVVGASGAVAGFFTYYDDDNEADVEILTQYPSNQYQYTNQPSVSKGGDEITAATKNVTMPSGDAADDWTLWHEHRIDWLPHRCNWYLDGRLVATNTYSVPRKPSGLILNMWSNGGTWSGNMTEGDAAEFHIQWVQMVFNTSGPRGGPDADSKKMRRADNLLEEGEWPEEQLGHGHGEGEGDGSDDEMQRAIWRDWDSDVEEDDDSDAAAAAAASSWNWPDMVDALTSWGSKKTTTKAKRDHPLTPVLEKRKKHQKEPGCETICRVDGVKAVGYPEVAYVSTGDAAGLAAGHGIAWLAVAAVGALLAWS